MKNNKLRVLCALLAAALLLPSCGGGTDTPAPAAPSSEGADIPSDAASDIPSETPFRSLSDEEAEALFGRAVPVSYVDGDWHYFLADFSNGMTVYRYHYDTGALEFGCKKPGCEHTDDIDWGVSSCPLYQHMHTGFEHYYSVMNGKLIRFGGSEYIYDENGQTVRDEETGLSIHTDTTLQWYDSETDESRIYTIAEPFGQFGCYRVGDSFYYDRSVYLPETGSSHHELWRVDENGGEPTLVVTGHDGDYAVVPYLLGEETVYIDYSFLPPDGASEDGDAWRDFWLYRIDEETGEHSLFYHKAVPTAWTAICGDYLFYVDFDSRYWQSVEDPENVPPPPKTLRLVKLSTGEEKALAGNIEDFYGLFLTDNCAMWLQDDPTGENAYILHCYDYLAGEKAEYPLHGDKWKSSDIYYDRGQVYFLHGSRNTGGPYSGVSRDMVVWDIASGAIREIDNGKIVKEAK